VISEEIDVFWEAARHTTRSEPDASAPSVSSFGATPDEADALLALVLEGTKTATAGALWDYEHEDETLPEVGDLSILLDGSKRPRALVQVTQVEIVPFDEVSEEQARSEGEGDLSLAYWRVVHERFFTDVATHGRGFSQTMPVLVQRFRLLFSR